MASHIKQLQEFIRAVASRDNHTPSDENLDECLKAIEDSLRSFFKGRKPSISPSQTSLTPRQIKLILDGKAKHNPDKFTYSQRLKMLIASISEHVLVFLMKEAGIGIKNEQRKCHHVLADDKGRLADIVGSCDYTLDGYVRDFKCSNDDNFSGTVKCFRTGQAKPAKWSSAKAIATEDSFGYKVQGKIYAESGAEEGWAKKRFGGWDVYNLNTGEIKSISAKETYDDADMEYDMFLTSYREALEADSHEDFEYCHPTWTDKQGRTRLYWQCVKCESVEACFPESERLVEGKSIVRIIHE